MQLVVKREEKLEEREEEQKGKSQKEGGKQKGENADVLEEINYFK